MTNETKPFEFPHYKVSSGSDKDAGGMEALHAFFPDCSPNYMNFVLFSTSGMHGSHTTIEDIERDMALSDQEIGDPDERCSTLTYLVVQPRLVAHTYGNCQPQNQADIDWLKQLRARSAAVMAKLSFPQ